MSRKIKITCDRCGHVNVFSEEELVGEVPLIDEDGKRVAPPAVEIDRNTLIQCERCNGPASCRNYVTVSD